MATAIRKSLRDFLAVMVLIVIALVTTYVILQEQRLRIPILEEKPFELKAEFQTVQAVVPGQGQTVRVAGVRIGDVQDVELEEGRGVVTFAIDREFLPVYNDATILMRPTTGLKDMFFDMDPGTRAAGEVEEGGTIAIANTAPDVNLDEILDALDADTQAYLRLLLVGAGKGLEGRGRDLGELLGSLGPINRDLRRLNVEVAKRKRQISTLVHNLRELTGAVGTADTDIVQLVDSANAALGAIAEQDPNVQRAISLLPGTLSQTRETLGLTTTLANELGPTFNELRPFAQNLEPLNASLERLANASTPVLKNEVRPFVRSALPVIPDLKVAAKKFAGATPDLTTVGEQINRLGNMATQNPGGAEAPGAADRDEGYLYWAAWLGHNSNSVFQAQDANGLYRRIYFTAGCPQIAQILSSSPLAPIVTGLGPLFASGGVCNP